MLSKLRMSLRAKMLLTILLPTIALLFAIGLVAFHQVNRMLLSNAQVVASSYSSSILTDVSGKLNSDLGFTRRLSNELSGYNIQNIEDIPRTFSNVLKDKLSQESRYSALWIFLEHEGNDTGDHSTIIRSAYSVALNRSTGEFTQGMRPLGTNHYIQAYIRAISNNQESIIEPQLQAYNDAFKTYIVSVCSPITVGDMRGFIAADIPVSQFNDAIEADKPYPNADAVLLSSNGIIIGHTNALLIGDPLYENKPQLEIAHNLSDKLSKGLPYSFSWREGGKSFFSTLSPTRFLGTSNHWVLMLNIPQADIYANAVGLRLILIASIILIIALILLLVALAARMVSHPLKGIAGVIKALAQGDIESNREFAINGSDEISSISTALKEHIYGLNQTEQFAREIGKGNLETDYKLHGQKDTLGKALIEMKDSLRQAKEYEQERKDEEQKQNWATQGIAIFSDILRRNNDDMEEFTYAIIQKMVEYTESVQGGIFIINEDEDDNRSEAESLDMVSSYAYDRRRFIEKSVASNEGLIGRCYSEGRTILLSDIPSEYIKITSGLGDTPPQNLILVPLKSNDEILGVMEIASLNHYTKYQIDFIERIADSIGSTLQAVRVSIRTNALLSRSQQQAEEMTAQEEEMRQNMEELQATQEDMERKRIEQDELQEVLKKEEALLSTLLNNIPDYIYFKDLNSRFIRISKSMINLFKESYTPDELIGKSDFDFHTQEYAQKQYDDEQQIIKGVKPPMVNEVAHEVLPNGREQWVSSTKMPLTDEEGNVIGIWGISKIITEIKNAELEAKAKGQEALDISNKHIITKNEYKGLVAAIDSNIIMIEYDTDGVITHVNRPAEKLFGLSELQLKGMKHSDLLRSKDEDDVQLLTFWNDLRKGIIRNRTYKGEINKSPKVLHETYSPIKNIDGDVSKIIAIIAEDTSAT